MISIVASGTTRHRHQDLEFFMINEQAHRDEGTQKHFIISRATEAIPEDISQLKKEVWFCMWRKRMWPYREVGTGNTLYWYDTDEKAIALKSQIIAFDRFKYESKDEVRQRIIDRFHIDPSPDPYFKKKNDEQGYCIAFRASADTSLNIPIPEDLKFPLLGWLRCDEKISEHWLKERSPNKGDGTDTSEINHLAQSLSNEGYFNTQNLEDERKRTQREVVQRRGQPDFRKKILAAYNARCAVTSCNAPQALEAAHIIPYLGEHSNHVSNGLLLRSDIHTLFDLRLIGIHPKSHTVSLAPGLTNTCYKELEGKGIVTPDNPDLHPSQDALSQRWDIFEKNHKS